MYAPKWYLGHTRGIKGHEDLIDALTIVRKDDPSVLGVIIGGPWNNAAAYERRIHAYAKRCLADGIVFLGTRTDVPELYPDLDVVVHPSHSENVGGAAESLILVVPTISTNVGGFPDVVRPGETGWLVNPRRPAELAEAIRQALADPGRARAMAQRGRDHTRRLFDVVHNAGQVLNVYNTILSAGASKVAVPAG
jgi:glycosyltransferase involved in cell wall biosynthesis